MPVSMNHVDISPAHYMFDFTLISGGGADGGEVTGKTAAKQFEAVFQHL